VTRILPEEISEQAPISKPAAESKQPTQEEAELFHDEEEGAHDLDNLDQTDNEKEEGNQGDDKDDEPCTDTLSKDTYSFFILTNWATIPFLYALSIVTLQASVFSLLGAYLIDRHDDHNPLGIPANVSFVVRLTQILAILITVATQADIQISANLLYSGFNIDLQAAFPTATRNRWAFSIGVRFLGGTLGLLVTFLLIVTAETVIDVLLNFTAMEFVSKLDEVAFFLAQQGFVGLRNQTLANQIFGARYNSRTTRKVLRRTLVLLLILAGVIGGTLYICMDCMPGFLELYFISYETNQQTSHCTSHIMGPQLGPTLPWSNNLASFFVRPFRSNLMMSLFLL
jgi:hypothetical protein